MLKKRKDPQEPVKVGSWPPALAAVEPRVRHVHVQVQRRAWHV